MRRGAFVMLDALGFRRIWERYPPEAVVAQLEALSIAMQGEAAKFVGPPGDRLSPVTFVKPVFLSDTIVFGLAMKPLAEVNANRAVLGVPLDEEGLAAEAVRLAAHFVAVLQRRAIVGTPPLAYRGCIALGTFGMTDRFIIGAAVDEAATVEKLPQGAFVVLTPGAAALPHFERETGISPLMRYDVPLKGKATAPFSTRVVVPYELPEAPEGDRGVPWPRLVDRLATTFVTSDPARYEDVAEKKRNTLAFMAAINPAERLTPEAFLKKTLSEFEPR
jgi:class 3 adenylate cyclase